MKNKKRSLRICLIALAVVTPALLSGCAAEESKEVSCEVSYTEVSYGQVLQMFREEDILRAKIDHDGTLTFETDQGFFCHMIYAVDRFYEDLHEEIDRLIENGRFEP